MTPRDLLDRFVKLAPQFQEQWDSDRNYFRGDDGAITHHGVCSEFSRFFRDHHASMTEATLLELFDLVERNLVEPGTEETLVDNALCTCFLENISSEPCGEFAKPRMGRKSRVYFDQWHRGPPH